MTTYITTHWIKPDPEIVAQRLFTIANHLDDTSVPMVTAGALVNADIQSNFASESDPDGTPWQGWTDHYEPFALAHGSGKKLNLYGHLQGAIGDPGAFFATDEGLFLDTSGLPEYWAWNHFGSSRRKRGPARSSTITKEGLANRARNIILQGRREGRQIDAQSALRAAARQYKADLATGGTNELPPRPFVGISKEAAAKIDRAFAMWFNGVTSSISTPTVATDFAVSQSGTKYYARRYPKGTPGGLGGKFMPRGS